MDAVAKGPENMNEFWTAVLHINTLTTTLRLATPIALAAMAGTVSERAGVINIGLEAKLLAGAFAGAAGAYFTGSPWVGLLAALGAGALVGALFALFTLQLRADHVVAGIGLNIFILGLTTGLLQVLWGSRGTSPAVPGLPKWSVPMLKQLPGVGPLFANHSPLVYATLILAVGLTVWLFQTPSGLRLRIVGEHPLAADSVGIDVQRTRLLLLIFAGALAALGGAQLSLGHLSLFSQNMSAGRGYIALAANVFGRWHPGGALAAALLFAFTDALQMRIQTMPDPWPSELVQMLPYALTVLVLAGAFKRARPPAALGTHYPPDRND